MAQAPVAEAPTYQVGDEWRYSNGAVLRVVAIEEGHVVTTWTPNRGCPDCRDYRDKNFTIVKQVDKSGAPVSTSTIGFKTLDFPLQVDKEWQFRQDLFSRSYNRLMPYDNSFRIEGYEDVKTKAGTFKAFKIGYIQENKGPYPWTGRVTSWYSPEAKAFVKRVVHTRGFPFDDAELDSYTLK